MGSIGAMSQGSSDRYFQDVEDDIKNLFRKASKDAWLTKAISGKWSPNTWAGSAPVWATRLKDLATPPLRRPIHPNHERGYARTPCT